MRGKLSLMLVLGFAMALAVNVAAVGAAEIELRFASGYIPWPYKCSCEEVKGPEMFCDLVNKNGAGKVSIEFFHSGQLFKDKDMTTAIPKGSVDMGIVNNSQWLSLIPGVALFELPFLFENEEHFYRTFEGEAGKLLAKEFEKHNLKLLGIWKNGPIVILTKEKAVAEPDLTGVKLRVYGKVPGMLARAVNGSPIFMSSSEFYLALQRGTVDGLFTSTYGMAGYKLYEVTKYTTGLPDYYATFPIVINLTRWNSLPSDVQKILADAAQETMDRARNEKWTPKHAEECFEVATKNGMIRHELTREEYQGWKKAARKVHEEYVDMAGDFGKRLLSYAEDAAK